MLQALCTLSRRKVEDELQERGIEMDQETMRFGWFRLVRYPLWLCQNKQA